MRSKVLLRFSSIPGLTLLLPAPILIFLQLLYVFCVEDYFDMFFLFFFISVFSFFF